MANKHGHFVWCELMTTDAPSATAFYRTVVGWGAQDAGVPDRHYTIVSAGETPVGGIMEMPPDARAAGARPGWIAYIGVDDVDSYAAHVTDAGGSIHRAAEDIPGVGRFAVVADPQGAGFILFRPFDGGAAPPPAGPTPGRVGWYELHAANLDAALAFYADMFGWTKTEAVDLGPMGTYQTFATGGPSGDSMVGGMMTKTDAFPKPLWLQYFNVDEIEAAVARTKQAGGQILFGPHEVPGGSWIAQCADPQGTTFSLIGPHRPA